MIVKITQNIKRFFYYLLFLMMIIGCQKSSFEVENHLKQARQYITESQRYLEEWNRNIILDSLTSPNYIEQRVTCEKKFREINQKAIKYYEKTIKKNSNLLNETDYLKLGEAYLRTIDKSKPSIQTPAEKNEIIDKAIKMFKKVIELKPKVIEGYLKIATCYAFFKQEYNEAINECQKALSLRPQNSNIYAIIGEIYRKEGKFKQAEVNFKKAIEIDNKNVEAHLGLGIVYFYKSQSKKAVDELKQVVNFQPNHLEAKLMLKMINDSDSIIRQTTEKLKKDPNNVNLLITIGSAYMQKCNWNKALQKYEQAYKLCPDSYTGFHLGYFIVCSPLRNDERKIKRAIKVLEEAQRINPKDFSILQTLGESYKICKEYKKALKLYEKLLKIDPNSALTYYYLGEVYEKLGRWKKANYYFKKSAELEKKVRWCQQTNSSNRPAE